MKVVINTCYGGFGLSELAYQKLGIPWDSYGYVFSGPNQDRADPKLVAVVEELGPAASGALAKLQVIEVPDGVSWHIEEYDGREWVAEDHRTWGDG